MRIISRFLLVAGLVCTLAAPAAAAGTGNDPQTAAADAAAWLASRITSTGYIESAYVPGTADLSVSTQAVLAFASLGSGRAEVDALLGYVGAHIDEFVVQFGVESPGALGYLIMAAVAAGGDPTAFGTPPQDLVARLEDMQQPSGLFGVADASYDGAYRQGLAVMALQAAGRPNAAGAAWLIDQQCASGLWVPFRADTTAACPPVDLVNFTGPDTNSTALAILALHAHGDNAPAAAGIQALGAVRNSNGGWGYFGQADQATDGNSTGVVLSAFRAVQGTTDTVGTAALLGLQVGCAGDAADRGGIAYQPAFGTGELIPDASVVVQAIPALAGVVLPLDDVAIVAGVPQVCAPPPSTTTTVAGPTPASTSTTSAVSAASVPTTVASTPTTVAAMAELPRTGSGRSGLGPLGLALLALGVVLTLGTRRVRAVVLER